MTKDTNNKNNKNFEGIFRKILITVIAILTGVNAITIVLQVIMRYFLKISIAWTHELAGVSLAWITFLGATLITADESHIGMDIILVKLKPKMRLIFRIVINIFIFIVCFVMIKYGIISVQKGFNSKLLSLPGTLGTAMIVVPLSGLMMAVIVVNNTLKDIKAYKMNITTNEIEQEKDDIHSDIPEEVLKRAKEAFKDEYKPTDKPDVKDGGDDK